MARSGGGHTDKLVLEEAPRVHQDLLEAGRENDTRSDLGFWNLKVCP